MLLLMKQTLIAIDLSKQQELDADPKAIQHLFCWKSRTRWM